MINENKLTSKLPEVKQLLDTLRLHKRTIKKLRTKLNSTRKENQFLIDILDKEQHDPLEIAVKIFLKKIGYGNTVKHLNKRKNHDLMFEINNIVTLIEVKGKKLGGNPSDEDCHVISRYMTRYLQDNPDKNVKGIFVLNHHCAEKDIAKRDKNCFSPQQIKDAENDNYGLITTLDLYNAYIKVKNNEMTFYEFDTKIHETGLIKFKK
jgi:hypothetical protein